MESCRLPISDSNSTRITDPKTKAEETTGACFTRLTKGSSDSADSQCNSARKEATDAYTKLKTACSGVDSGMEVPKCIEYNKECKDKEDDTEQSTSEAMGQQMNQTLAQATGTAPVNMSIPQSTDSEDKPCPKMTYEKWQDGFKSISTSLDEANKELGKLSADLAKVDTERNKDTNRTSLEMNRMEREFDEKNKSADADIRENIRKGVQGFNSVNAEIRGLEEKIRNDQNVLVFIYQEKALLLSQGSKAIMRFECTKKLQDSLKNLPSIKSGGLKNLVFRSGSLNTVKQDAVNECLLALKAGREKAIKEKEMLVENAKSNIKNNEIRLAELRQELSLNQSHFEQAKAAADDSKNKSAAQQAKEMMAKGQENINSLQEAQSKKQAIQTQIQQQQKIVTRQSNQIAGLGSKPDADQTETGKSAMKAFREWEGKMLTVRETNHGECCTGFSLCDAAKSEVLPTGSAKGTK